MATSSRLDERRPIPAYDESDLESTCSSLRMSIHEYVRDHGRSYHKYQEGKYLFPNDAAEQDRYNIVHNMYLLALHGQLYLAPVDDARNVLDIGTGTGIWALEFADQHPDAQVLGNDLSSMQMQWVLPNCRFVVDDVEGDWIYEGQAPFDYIHQRSMCGSFGDWPRLFRQGYENLISGGWYEMQEMTVEMEFADESDPNESDVSKWLKLLDEATEKVGRRLNCAADLEAMFRNAGFVEVQHEEVKIPFGRWPEETDQRTLGMFSLMSYVDGLEAISLAPFIHILGWTERELKSFLHKVRRECLEGQKQMYSRLHVVYGRKP
ncbi:uncharacterized protein HMPREF1541_09601 [Cyphellophora europaea CBS 101466]|uniref:Methyltransferase domain-containing protein n=1 Tax=Cyphellophora europaea (strain CBS 101466) TaxID=1220924 RepID=W2SCK6_CYPE1|nr:uncharacterized protein HMPREF1541_09601 [Cyphellophora europaea CBS 101466]ETN45768.1 hypothetical protein HMPREF1541_09601 [Cyphellophora europaea CBS 101466]